MHSGSSNINVPVEIDVQASARAQRGDETAPQQVFRKPCRTTLRAGDTVLNALTNTLHKVVEIDADSVTVETAVGNHTVSWRDVEASCWQVIES